jgi:hypothetical protein
VEVNRAYDPPLEFTYNKTPVVQLSGYNGAGWHVQLDNITLDFDIEFA